MPTVMRPVPSQFGQQLPSLMRPLPPHSGQTVSPVPGVPGVAWSPGAKGAAGAAGAEVGSGRLEKLASVLIVGPHAVHPAAGKRRTRLQAAAACTRVPWPPCRSRSARIACIAGQTVLHQAGATSVGARAVALTRWNTTSGGVRRISSPTSAA